MTDDNSFYSKYVRDINRDYGKMAQRSGPAGMRPEPPALFIVENARSGDVHIISSDEFNALDFGSYEPEETRVDWMKRIELALLCICFFCLGLSIGWMINVYP